MRRLALLPALAAFLLNPSACSHSSDPQYQYGAEELRAALEGTWDLTLATDGGAMAALVITMKQRGASGQARGAAPALVREAHACGTRTLIASADACADSTEMPLDVTFQSGDSAFGDAVIWDEARGASSLGGNFRVDSLIFTTGMLDLTLGDVRISADIEADGTVISAQQVGLAGNVTLARRQR